MKRRAALVVFAVLAASLVAGTPAMAEDSEDSGSDDGGESEGGDDGTSGGGDDGGSGGDDGGSGGSTGGGTSGGGGSGSEASSSDDHEDALKAVKNGRAVPLKQVLASFKTDFGATVLDVALMQMEDALRYRITFVDADGRVRRVYYFAETGELIR